MSAIGAKAKCGGGQRTSGYRGKADLVWAVRSSAMTHKRHTANMEGIVGGRACDVDREDDRDRAIPLSKLTATASNEIKSSFEGYCAFGATHGAWEIRSWHSVGSSVRLQVF